MSTDETDELIRSVAAIICPHPDCLHLDTVSCSGWAHAEDALTAVPDDWTKSGGQWVPGMAAALKNGWNEAQFKWAQTHPDEVHNP